MGGGYLPLGWAGRTGTGQDSVLKSVLPTPEALIAMLVLFPGGRLGVLWYWGGSLGTQGWYPNCSWPLAAFSWRLTVGGQSGRERRNRRWVSVDPSLLTCESEVDVEGAEGLTIPYHSCKSHLCVQSSERSVRNFQAFAEKNPLYPYLVQ